MRNTERCADILRAYNGPPLRLMEVCGTHTHAIFEYGIRAMLPPGIELVSGPGCPVCVTPAAYIDRAADLALQNGHVLCTFGDMLRVPGERDNLLEAKASGGDVRMMVSPMDVLSWAAAEPRRTFVVAAVGFETTLPVYALLAERLAERNIRNVRLLCSLKAIVPALQWICESELELDGFLGPGHVSAIIGSDAYAALCARYRKPLAVGGFTYEQILAALCDLIDQTRRGTCEAHNLYPSAVTAQGNPRALSLIGRVFTLAPSAWRGLGTIDASGYVLRPEYAQFDAGAWEAGVDQEAEAGCLCGQVIIGRASPADCPNYGAACTPASPLGPCMVSREGTCSAWYENSWERDGR
jgi:hydrogenase expression/formation protein HypD